MLELLPQSSGNILGLKLTDTLHKNDYKIAEPEFIHARQEGTKVRLLLWYDNFVGTNLDGLWNRLKLFDEHRHLIERIAIVGSDTAEESWPQLDVPRHYFELSEMDTAWAWLQKPLAEVSLYNYPQEFY